jgi:TolB protein
VAFTSARGGGRDLWLVAVATGTVTRLTTGLDVWSQPSWSPDAGRLLFSAAAAGVHDLYVVNADGTELRRLTRGFDGRR